MASFTVNHDVNLLVGPFQIVLAAGSVGYVPDDLMAEVEEAIEANPGYVVTQLDTDRAAVETLYIADLNNEIPLIGAVNRIFFDGATVTIAGSTATVAAPTTAIGVILTAANTVSVPNSTYPGTPFNLTHTGGFASTGFHDNATNPSRITIPTGMGGKYALTYRASWESNATGERLLYYSVNGTVSASPFLSRIQANATWDTAHGGADVLDLAAGDYVQVYGYQTRGSALRMDACRVTLFRIGA